jgi:glycosyltransferase involved in cell wall biosynthesis
MPAWQAERTVGAAASSVLCQTYEDLELVVVDDGSTDGTAGIVAAHGTAIRLIRQDHAGIAEARNRGIAEARGELIAFCDSDDVLFPRHIEQLVDHYDRSGGIVTANAWLLFPGGIHPGRTRHKGRFPPVDRQRQAILEQNFLCIMSIFPRQLFDAIGPFKEGLHGIEDWDFWMRAVYAGYPVIHQPHPSALYRWAEGGLSANVERSDAAVRTLFELARTHLDLSASERRYVDRRLSGPDPREYGRAGDEALRSADYQRAAWQYRQAAELCPTEHALRWKARVLTLAPRIVGPAVRARQLRIERATGFDERHIR